MALSSGDYFAAYRLALAFEDQNKDLFLKTGVDGYFKSLFLIGSQKEIQKQCDKLSKLTVKASYLCALYLAEQKKTEMAAKYLKKIDSKTKFHYPAQILRASIAIIESNFEQAVEILNPDEIEKYAQLQLDQLFYLTRSRALLGLNRFEEATKYSQSINSKSPYYVEALEQTAWIFFKSRKFESAQILLEVMISTYESPLKIESDLKVSTTQYFKARYLKAYLALLEQKPEGAANEFSQLKGDYDKFLYSLSKEKFQDEVEVLKTEPIVSSEVSTYTPKLNAHLDYVKEWLGAEVGSHYLNEIKLQAAINNEITRLEKFDGELEKKYSQSLKTLKVKSFARFKKQYFKAQEKLAQAMGTLSLKCELGRLDVFWLNRAQGARNLEEVIDNYKASTKSIGAYVDL
ncbi:MAG: hypothetical protein IPM57_08945 [Oligoflexia bacterium]|nr:hypothetical protein [Oligoflexia bacterium]